MPAPNIARTAAGDYLLQNGVWLPVTCVEGHGTAAVGAGLTVSLPAAVGVTNWITAFGIEWASDGVGTVNTQMNILNLLFGAWSAKFTTVAGAGSAAGSGLSTSVVELPHPMAATGANVAISVNAPVLANRASLSLHIWGYRL